MSGVILLLADGGTLLATAVVLLLIVAGIIAFFATIAGIAFRILQLGYEVIFGRSAMPPGAPLPAARQCRNQRCRALNRPHARFCLRCGERLA